MKLSLRSILFFAILAGSLPCFAGQFRIEIGPGGIKGSSDGVPLGKILGSLAEKSGYAIYLDQNMIETPVTFNISENLTADEAIRRMVQPNSSAFVYGGNSEDNTSTILEVWICRKGRTQSGKYVALKNGADAGSSNASANNISGKGNTQILTGSSDFSPVTYEVLSSSGSRVSEGVSGLSYNGNDANGLGRGRSIAGKDLLRSDYYVRTSPFGTPILGYKDKDKGPDYKPNAQEMKAAYEKYQQGKALEEHQENTAVNELAQKEDQSQKGQYSLLRNQELQNMFFEYQKKLSKEQK